MSKPIRIQLPGSKSYTNRALICSALAMGETRLRGIASGNDSLVMMKALTKFGVTIHLLNEKRIWKKFSPGTKAQKEKTQEALITLQFVNSLNGKAKKQMIVNNVPHILYQKKTQKQAGGKRVIDIGDAGTTMRFLTTFIGLLVPQLRGEVILTGSKRMQERPIGDLVNALNDLGMDIEYAGKKNFPPLRLKKPDGKVRLSGSVGGRVKLKGDSSSQYLSSILLCAPYFDKDTYIEVQGELTSKPYVDMTVEVMNSFGVDIENKNYKKFTVKAHQTYSPRTYVIEPDASGASYFIAGSALTGKSVVFPGLKRASSQGDVLFAQIVEKMQNGHSKSTSETNVSQSEERKKSKSTRELYFRGRGSLQAIEIDMNAIPDTVQTLAVLSMFAEGRTKITNVAHLRIKETDRLKALETEIKKFEIHVRAFADGIEIKGKPAFKVKKKIEIETYNDHRMAMAFAVAKLAFPDIIIKQPECVSKSFPNFWIEWKKFI